MNIELNIEQLVLHGVDVRDRRGLQAAVEAELSRLFAERGLPPALAQGGYVPHLDGGTANLAPGAQAANSGVQIARAVYGGLNK